MDLANPGHLTTFIFRQVLGRDQLSRSTVPSQSYERKGRKKD
jgi:hypothetical protein